jgi:hypothetical protein
MAPKRPFSAPKPRSLPTPTGTQDLASTLASWQSQLNPTLKNAAPQPTPVNFKVTSSRGGLTLAWSPVSGADGYEILKSQNGSFTDDLQVIPVVGGKFSSYFDSTGGNALTAHYRIRTTSGTAQNPQSQRGPESGVVSHTSIDSSDTVTQPTTRLDQYTSDKTRSNARFGNYGTASATSNLGKTGGTFSGAGVAGGSGTSGGTPATGSTSFAAISTGENTTATMIVGPGAQIVPDSTSPGIIAATNVIGTPLGFGATSTADAGISRLAAGSLAIGNGAAGDFSGLLKLGGVTLTSTGTGANTCALTFGVGSTAPHIYSDAATYIQFVCGAATLNFDAVNGISTPATCVLGSATKCLQAGSTAGVGGFVIGGTGVENLGLRWTASTKILELLNATASDCTVWSADAGIKLKVPILCIGSTDTGITRLGAASLAIGNGTAGDITGNVSLGTLTFSSGASYGLIKWPNVTTGDFAGLDWFRAGSWGSRLRVDAATGTLKFFNTGGGGEVLAFSVTPGGDATAVGNLGGNNLILGTVAGSYVSVIEGFGGYTGAAIADAITLKTYERDGNAQPVRLSITGDTAASGAGIADVRLDNARLLLAVNTGGVAWTDGVSKTVADTGLTRLGAASLAIGNGTASDVSGSVTLATVTQQSANGAQWVHGQASELLTLSTVGTTTDTAGNLLPANAIIESVVARVTTTITTATNWELGDATTAGRFSAPNSTMTVGTTQVGLVHVDQTGAAGPRQTAAARVRVTTTGTPGAGAIRITVFYRSFVAPSS